MRPHLQHHDTGALIGDFQLVAPVLFDLLGQGKAVHGQGGKDIGNVDEREDIDKQQRRHGGRDRHNSNKKTEKCSAGNLLPALNRSCKIEQQDRDQRQQDQRIQGTADKPAV